MKKAMSLVLVLSLAVTMLVSVAPSRSSISARLTPTKMEKAVGGTPDAIDCGVAIGSAILFFGSLFVFPEADLAVALYAGNAILSPTAIGYGFTKC